MSAPTAVPVVVITGAAGGLGSALVAAFAKADWHVVAAWNRTPWREVSSEREGPTSASTQSPAIWPVHLDVTRSEAVTAVFDQVLTRFGRLDVLINNAGIARDSLLAQMTDPDWQAVLDVNLRGAFLCSQAAVRLMLRQRDGHILNISSFGGRVGRAGQTNYAASKAGLIGFTQSLAKEVGPQNVRVNAVLPGFLLTKLVGSLTAGQIATHAASNALGRLNDFAEVARFVEFLARMRNVSGQVFQLDSRIGPWS